MKKMLVMGGALAILLSSCSVDSIHPTIDTEGYTVIVNAKSIDTKTAFGTPDGNLYPTLWTSNKDACFSLNEGDLVYASPVVENEGAGASFSVTFKSIPAANSKVWALSPKGVYASKTSKDNVPGWTNFQGGTKQYAYFTIPSSQTPLAGSCDESAQAICGTGVFAADESGMTVDDINVTFHHVVAYGKVTIANFMSPIKTVSLKFPQNVAGLSCKFYYMENEGAGRIDSASLDTDTITLDATNAVNNTLWFACYPTGKLESGDLVVTVTGEDNTPYSKTIGLSSTKFVSFNKGEISSFTVDMGQDKLKNPIVSISSKTNESFKASWSVAANVAKYQYYLTTADGSSVDGCGSSVSPLENTTGEVNLNGLTANTAYKFYIKAIAPVDASYSDAASFDAVDVTTYKSPFEATDVLVVGTFGATSTTYIDASEKTKTSSAVYAANVAAYSSSAISLRATNPSGIVTTWTGGYVQSVSIDWNTNTQSSKTIDVYGSNTPYSGPADLYETSKRGTKIGSIVKGTSTSLNFVAGYKYIGIRSNSGALYANSITVEWGLEAPKETCIAPKCNTANGEIVGGSTVTLSTTTEGASIYYTIDGTDPTSSSTLYAAPGIVVNSDPMTIKAIAIKDGYKNSTVSTFSFYYKTCATPTFSRSSGSVASGTKVTLGCTTPGAVIYYTQDGSSPTTSSSVYNSEGDGIEITSACTLKAIAVASGYKNSAEATVSYTISATGAEDHTITWTATKDGLGTTTSATFTDSAGNQWTCTRNKVVYTGFSSNCIQFGSKSGAETVTLSTSNIQGTIKSVMVECSSYNGAHTVEIAVGGTEYLASTATPSWTTVSSLGKSEGGASSGDIVISFKPGTRALYIKSITVVANY